jgi:hypothetical protein
MISFEGEQWRGVRVQGVLAMRLSHLAEVSCQRPLFIGVYKHVGSVVYSTYHGLYGD